MAETALTICFTLKLNFLSEKKYIFVPKPTAPRSYVNQPVPHINLCPPWVLVKHMGKAEIRAQPASSSVWAVGVQLPSWERLKGAEPEHLSMSHPWDAALGLDPTWAKDSSSQRNIQREFLFCSLQVALRIIKFRSKDTRRYWTHLLSLARCPQTLLACPWSSYPYSGHMQFWSKSPFRFWCSQSRPYLIIVPSGFLNNRQSIYKR